MGFLSKLVKNPFGLGFTLATVFIALLAVLWVTSLATGEIREAVTDNFVAEQLAGVVFLLHQNLERMFIDKKGWLIVMLNM